MIVRVLSFLFGMILTKSSLQESNFEGSVSDSYLILSKAYTSNEKIIKIASK